MTLIEQLRCLGRLKVGEPFPDFLFDVQFANNWGTSLSKICNDAADALDHRRYDPLAGSDTYDLLGDDRAAVSLEPDLRTWSRLEQHELLQMPEWAAKVSKLLGDAAREIERLKLQAGVVTAGPDFHEIKSAIEQRN